MTGQKSGPPNVNLRVTQDAQPTTSSISTSVSPFMGMLSDATTVLQHAMTHGVCCPMILYRQPAKTGCCNSL